MYTSLIFLFALGSESHGYCAPYSGEICKKYLAGIGKVWFNDSKDNPGGLLNEQITTDLWDELILKLKEPCRSAAEVSTVICPNIFGSVSCKMIFKLMEKPGGSSCHRKCCACMHFHCAMNQ